MEEVWTLWSYLSLSWNKSRSQYFWEGKWILKLLTTWTQLGSNCRILPRVQGRDDGRCDTPYKARHGPGTQYLLVEESRGGRGGGSFWQPGAPPMGVTLHQEGKQASQGEHTRMWPRVGGCATPLETEAGPYCRRHHQPPAESRD